MPLTNEQLEIVNLPLTAKVLVTAGPGTGKTHTLISRIAHLIKNDDIAPGQELLILSFSRAAVREIRNRCTEVGGDLAYVNVITFDSYATRLLSMIEPDGDWTSHGYDGRIEHAVKAIEANLAEDYLCDIKHVFVDEIQDLVGIRAEFVKKILGKTNAGFGLFGDPAQGIYNFQLEDPEDREIGSAALYKWVRDNFDSRLTEKQLTENHRAASKAAQTALWAGAELNQNFPSFKLIYDCLTSDLRGLQLFGTQDDFADKLKRARGRTAILCRNNGQALMLSRKLHEAEIEHSLGRGAEDRSVPSWITRVLAQSANAVLSKNSFADYCLYEGIDESEIEEKWRLLKKTEGEGGKSLNLFKLNSNCRQSNMPDWMNEYKLSQITISSIHRVKGLEFDTVIVAACDRSEDEEEYIGEECRTLYVALTRPKRNLSRLKIPLFKGLMLDKKYNRWCRRWDWKTPDMEVKFSDIDRNSPPEAITARGNSPAEIQEYISENVKIGDSVNLIRVGSNGNRYDAVYHILHNDFLIGRTLPDFAGELLNTIRQKYRKGELPTWIGPLPVENIETVFGDANLALAKGLESPAGVWLNARVGGLGKLKYGEND